jgi:hypothetical protein
MPPKNGGVRKANWLTRNSINDKAVLCTPTDTLGPTVFDYVDGRKEDEGGRKM